MRVSVKLEIILDIDTKDTTVATWDEVAAGVNEFIANNDMPSSVDLKWEKLED